MDPEVMTPAEYERVWRLFTRKVGADLRRDYPNLARELFALQGEEKMTLYRALLLDGEARLLGK